MKTLSFTEWCYYAPHNLKVMADGHKRLLRSASDTTLYLYKNGLKAYNYSECKPELHPLSSLDKRIECNGKTLTFCDFYISQEHLIIAKRCISMNLSLLDFLPFKVIADMCKFHFNAFNLDEKSFIKIEPLD